MRPYRDSSYDPPKADPFVDVYQAKPKLDRLRKMQREALEKLAEFDAELPSFANRVGAHLYAQFEKAFPGVRIYLQYDLQGGCHSLDWEPSVSVYDVEGLILFLDGNWYQERWDALDFEDCGWKPVPLTRHPAPLDTEKLQEIMANFERATGIRSYIYTKEFDQENQPFMEDDDEV